MDMRLFLFLVFSKLFQKLVITLRWNNKISCLSFPKTKRNKTGFWQFNISLFMAKSYSFLPRFRHHLLSKITVWIFKYHFSPGSRSQKILKLASLLHLGFSYVYSTLDLHKHSLWWFRNNKRLQRLSCNWESSSTWRPTWLKGLKTCWTAVAVSQQKYNNKTVYSSNSYGPWIVPLIKLSVK